MLALSRWRSELCIVKIIYAFIEEKKTHDRVIERNGTKDRRRKKVDVKCKAREKKKNK